MSGVLHGVIASLAGRVTDTFWKYVSLLLNTTSTNGAQNNTFLDSSTNNFTVTRNGDTTQGSFNPYMPTGYWSGYFDGNGDELNAGSNAAFSFGTGAYTVEAWVYLTAAVSASHQPCFVFNDTTGGFGFWNENGLNQLNIGSRAGSVVLASTTTLTANTWNHIVAVRSGTGANQTAIFVNGSRVANGTDATNWTVTGPLKVGGITTANYYLTGYQSNVRVVKGTAVYDPTQTTLTVPTSPLTAITNTSLLCLQDNRFKDNSTNAFAITANGDTRISKFAPFNPPASWDAATYGGSGYFDGSGDYLTVANASALQLTDSVAWCIEIWFYASAMSAQQHIFHGYNPNSPFQGWGIALGASAQPATTLMFWDGTTWRNIATSLTPNQWYHVAVTYEGSSTTGRLFLNGTQQGSAFAPASTINNTSNAIGIGGQNNGSLLFTGYVNDARIVKGTAVYTSNFTPPTAPLTAITNTSLLLNFTNAGIFDAATINDSQTVGNAQVSTTQAKFGTTSMYFDGTGDWLTIIDKPELRFGTGDFTIEGWVYLTATGVAYGLVSKGTSTTGWSVNVTSGNKLQFSYTSSNLTGATSLASGTWYYFAVVRSGTASGNLKVWLNGSTDATSAGAVNDGFNQTSTMYVGADRVAGAVLNGYLQDVRITNGYARTISTPTAAFPTL